MPQAQIFYDVSRKRAGANEFMMTLIRKGELTREQLQNLIEKRPEVYGRYKGFLSKLPSEKKEKVGDE